MGKILVSGDVVVDHHVYEGQRYKASATELRGVKVIREYGGAINLTNLISEIIARAVQISKDRKKDLEIKLQKAKSLKEANGSKDDAEIEKCNKQIKEAMDDLAKYKPAVEENWAADFILEKPSLEEIPCGHHALAIWKPYPKKREGKTDQEQVWRASLLMGYGHDRLESSESEIADGQPCTDHFQPKLSGGFETPNILLLDDAGFQFRKQPQNQQGNYWLLPEKGGSEPQWIILKMSGPVCRGDLWEEISKSFGKKLIVIVSAEDLRAEGANISHGLSWELTVENLRDALLQEPLLRTLAERCRHLVVLLSGDGALWLNCTDPKRRQATLVYDSNGIEGSWAEQYEGEAFGYMSCMAAAITRELIQCESRISETPQGEPLKLSDAISAGLSAMHDLREYGHGLIGGQDSATGYPSKRLADKILASGAQFQSVQVPWPPESIGDRGAWSILEQSQRPFDSDVRPSLFGLARLVVLRGRDVLNRYPHVRFGQLFSFDRAEIESLRAMRNLMTDYEKMKKSSRPLSIGVFGPPGAGKSFGVRHIASAIFGPDSWMEFNLSQFNNVGDIIGAFHQVRDRVLSGVTPVVFWDEFDAKKYDWLRHLLAPMQDGKFQEGQITHGIGKCVFIFAGATSHTFKDFGPKKADKEAWQNFKLLKGPDFHSRLDAYYNVLGPNQRLTPDAENEDSLAGMKIDPSDKFYPLRRSLLLRAKLAKGEKDRLIVDPGLLTALLEVPFYRHGARSLEKIALSLKPSRSGDAIRRSSLPAPTLLGMHLSFKAGATIQEEEDENDVARKFYALVDRDLAFRKAENIDKLAEAIHEYYRQLAKREGWSKEETDRDFADLSDFFKNSNRAAAERMIEILDFVGLRLESGLAKKEAEDRVRKYLEHHLELLANAEHEGWMNWHFQMGWQYSTERNDKLKRHNCLLAFDKLKKEDQQKDRYQVLHYPDCARNAALQIVFAVSDNEG